MTLQQWGFSFKGRIGRREFWIGIGVCLALMFVILTIQGMSSLTMHYAVFALVLVMYPVAAMMVKRLHDRNKRGGWSLLLLLAGLLVAVDWGGLAPFWQWGIGRFIPTLIIVMMVLDCGVFRGTDGPNRFGEATEKVDFISVKDD
ncbi:DUF805 domain-containing protein [Photorhabdus laumondii subsp. laumondii]|uniref:Photorhabdus luminescens subsp. laumondii TTO1 complete genome segment 16/17 n=3 Tax=Photorhabdus laumondii TaxID=2218628 RepID=Q7MYB5_PHOLL|nr:MULTISPECIES: DUF805 domain-containing protein [Photorhabdus]PQQ37807.1 DUF805 domain-containing protein [Photorhabdus luminescens]AXG44956.1 DUF805 domain-containing protein [Photorhabdus laumondii subsp. laumondii]AXG49589.1 DUF805 domain-containing protein [Photorhabdus laumondii subsp. laumondii]MCC8382919.1 DUF805 domain-containing protein [Photorhabdus laumondii]MCC8412256.1 DUF805 domain-containing protein [Photorhabdus laumondii]